MMKAKQLNLFGDEIPDAAPGSAKRSKVEVFEDYEGFVNKFEPKKTTDDCYTPPEIYDAVKQWVNDNIMNLEGVEIVRPFKPGGDYENEVYPEGCLVLDNPPFSILAQIRRYYHRRGIRYFLFAPALTLANSAKELSASTCFIIANAEIIYENKAVVRTSFLTKCDCGGVGVWIAGDLFKMIEAATPNERVELPKYIFPDHVISSATLGRIVCRGIQWKIPKTDCHVISGLDSMRASGKSIFGGVAAFGAGSSGAGSSGAGSSGAGSNVHVEAVRCRVANY